MEAILLEFSSTVEWLKGQLDLYRASHKESKQQMLKLLDHNRKLIAELKRFAGGEFGDYRGSLTGGSEINRELERRLRDAIESKATVMDMLQNTLKELELERQARYESTGEQVLEERIAAVNNHYAKGLNVLSSELAQARKDMVDAKLEAKTLAEELESVQDLLSNCREALKKAQSDARNLSSEKQELTEQVVSLKTCLAETTRTVDTKIKENSELIEQISKLKNTNKQLTDKLFVLSQEKMSSEKDAKDSLLTAQEAILQKKEVSFKEEVALKFIQSLKSSIDEEIEHATLRYKTEIKNLQKRHSEEVESLTKELKALQVESNEKQSSLEKLQRQINATEAKLDSLRFDSSQSISITVFNEMCHRLTLAEKARDEAVFRARSFEGQLKDSKQNNDRETEFHKSESKMWRDRFQKLQSDFAKSAEERVELMDKVINLRKKCALLEKDLEKNRDHYEKELAALGQRLHQKEEFFSQQMSLMEEQFRKVIMDQGKLLDAQTRTSKKWKDTVEELTVSSESKMKEMYRDIVHLQSSNQELLQHLEGSQVMASH